MKKQFTILSILTVAASFTFAQQTVPNFTKLQQKSVKISKHDSKSDLVSTDAKAGGDLVWSDDFSGTATWTMGGDGAQGTFVVGGYPADMSTYIGAMTNGTAPLASFNAIGYLLAAPGTPVGVQDCWIQSPIIDFSGLSSITVKFNQRYRKFNTDAVYVDVSTDNGANWTSYQVNTEAVGNGAVIQNTVSLDVPLGSTTVTQGAIRFHWESLTADDDYGSGYGWAIDNVVINEGFENNLNLSQIFTQVGTQGLSLTKIPSTQAASAGKVSFGAIIKNIGGTTQPTTLTVSSGAFSGASASSDILSFDKDSLSIDFASGFTIPATVGANTFTFTATSTLPLDETADDSKTSGFEVTESVMAADAFDGTAASMSGSFIGWQGGSGDAEIGTYFEIFNNSSIGAIQIGIANISSTGQGQYIGRTIYGKIYEIPADPNAEPILIDATLEREIEASDFGKTIKTYFISPIALEAGKTYLATGAMYLNFAVPVGFSGYVAAGNVAGVDGSNFIGLAADAALGNVVRCPIVRLDFKDYTGISELENTFAVNAYPNPFTNSTDVSFELANETSVSVQVTDLTGRVVMTVSPKTFSAGANKLTVDASGLNSGVYNYAITIGNQVITKRMIKN